MMYRKALGWGCALFCSFLLIHQTSALRALSNDVPQRIAHKCFGGTPSSRSCVFSNVFYNIANNTFHIIYSDQRFRVIRAEVNLHPVHFIHNLPAAPADKVQEHYEGLTMFWEIYHLSRYSFGHALIGALFPMYVALSNLLGDQVPFKFSVVQMHNAETPAVFRHISAATQDLVFHWGTVLKGAKAAGNEWIHFPTLMLGDGGLGYFSTVQYEYSKSAHPNVYNEHRWQQFRTWMLRTVGLDPNFRPTKLKITLNKKSPGDYRTIKNIDDLQGYLNQTFPQAMVQATVFPGMTWREQLQELTTTTLFITTQGSSSFRFIFLPAGASVIIFGHPAHPKAPFEPFHELGKYFPIAFIHLLKYSVSREDTSEYELPPMRLKDGWQWYDAHINVNKTKIEPLVKEGLEMYEGALNRSFNLVSR